MKTVIRFFAGLVLSFGFTVIIWELIKLLLNILGNFGSSELTRHVFIFFMGMFFSMGFVGYIYHMAQEKYKTKRFRNTVFAVLAIFLLLFVARAYFFWDSGFNSVMCFYFSAGSITAAILWLFSFQKK